MRDANRDALGKFDAGDQSTKAIPATNGFNMISASAALWRRKMMICAIALASLGVSYSAHMISGDRYEANTLILIGHGVKESSSNDPAPVLPRDQIGRMNSLAQIVTTDYVLRRAATKVGFNRLFPRSNDALRQFASDALAYIHAYTSNILTYIQNAFPGIYVILTQAAAKAELQGLSLPLDELMQGGGPAISVLRNLVSAKTEGKSDLLKISFRHPDPVVAAEFVNELAASLITREAELLSVPGAEVFFGQQAKRLEQEVQKAATELQRFSKSASIYSISEQRNLLLKRATELASSIASTRGAIAEGSGQKDALIDQLAKLRPVTQSRTVTGIVRSLGGVDLKTTQRSPRFEADNNFPNDEPPPLLLVRVYQDAMAALLKVNTELSGATKLEKVLGQELDKVNIELAALSSKEAEYERLKRDLSRAAAAAENYSRRMIEEQFNVLAKKAQLSSLRIVQVGSIPYVPVFPTVKHFLLMGLVGGLALGVAIALLLDLLTVARKSVDYQVKNKKRNEKKHLKSLSEANIELAIVRPKFTPVSDEVQDKYNDRNDRDDCASVVGSDIVKPNALSNALSKVAIAVRQLSTV